MKFLKYHVTVLVLHSVVVGFIYIRGKETEKTIYNIITW